MNHNELCECSECRPTPLPIVHGFEYRYFDRRYIMRSLFYSNGQWYVKYIIKPTPQTIEYTRKLSDWNYSYEQWKEREDHE